MSSSLVRRIDKKANECYEGIQTSIPLVRTLKTLFIPTVVRKTLRAVKTGCVKVLSDAETWMKAKALTEEQQERLLAKVISLWVDNTNEDPYVAFQRLQKDLEKAYKESFVQPVHEIRATYQEYAGRGPITRGWKVTQQAGVQVISMGRLACGGVKVVMSNGAVGVFSVTKGTISLAGKGIKVTASTALTTSKHFATTALCTTKQVIAHIPRNKQQLMLRASEGRDLAEKYGNLAADKFLDTAKFVASNSPNFIKTTQTNQYIITTPTAEIKVTVMTFVKDGITYYAGMIKDPRGTLNAFLTTFKTLYRQTATRALQALPTRSDLSALPSTVRSTVAATPAFLRHKVTTTYEVALHHSTKVEAFVRSSMATVPFLKDYSDIELSQVRQFLIRQAAHSLNAIKNPVATTTAIVSFAKRAGGQVLSTTSSAAINTAAAVAGKAVAVGEVVVSKTIGKEPARRTAKRAILKAQKLSEKVVMYTPAYVKSAAESAVNRVKGVIKSVAGEGTPQAAMDFAAQILMISWIMEAKTD
uniref:Uncharacterized protein n=1 Tax=Chromera velia CCMP2878 TaxID=1169474 RepID=A0A0G4GQ56_9ALVE|eukprot:Cvel_710.t1-p1 / transcript=Cvel_710.t1 / gene=Cvel_710 / organism=Chromera_velia_CCMP2878 / gene_product=hypothetical protein / transcript_product=hypothetical protein / location=Cvel_scaffold22:67236-70127(+) / protein_length=529 / sequence_SO=supercontig / SO=protein_coding / is_pseudo=false